MKQALLGVNPHTLEQHGAVSRETVVEMVSGALVHSAACLAVAVTGIAGPGGGTSDKPVGTVHLALAGPGGTEHAARGYRGDRERVRRMAAFEALNLLRLALR